MIELDNQTTLDIDEEMLNNIASNYTDKEIELVITSKEEMQKINKLHRKIDDTTDVLSFPFEDTNIPLLGSIVISSWHIDTFSKELGHTQNDELALLFTHGLLHLMGFDHEVDDGEMRDEELKIIKEFTLPKSLIVRTQG